ncbi:RNA polymerase subunit sigma, partial [Streptomyces roseolus]
MTAAPPNDSGAAASRDAARTARRLTDGTLPRRSPSAEPAPAGERTTAVEPSPGPPDPRPTVLPPSDPGPTPSPPDAPTTPPPAGAAPVSAAPAARTDGA